MESAGLCEKLKTFPGLSAVGAESLCSMSRHGLFLELRKDRILYYQSDPCEKVFFLLSGSVRRVKFRSDESSLVIGRSTAGDWLGVCEGILGTPYLNDTVAERSTEVLAFSRTAFHHLLTQAAFQGYILKVVARSLYLLHGHLELNLPLNRLIHHLLTNVKKTPRPSGFFRLKATQQQIAEAIGVSRETVNRHLNELQRLGFLRIGRRYVEMDDPAALKTYLGS